MSTWRQILTWDVRPEPKFRTGDKVVFRAGALLLTGEIENTRWDSVLDRWVYGVFESPYTHTVLPEPFIKLPGDPTPLPMTIEASLRFSQYGREPYHHRLRVPGGTKYYNHAYLLHRTDGPAVEWDDGRQEWWLNGVYMTRAEFNQRTHRASLKFSWDIEEPPPEIGDIVYVQASILSLVDESGFTPGTAAMVFHKYGLVIGVDPLFPWSRWSLPGERVDTGSLQVQIVGETWLFPYNDWDRYLRRATPEESQRHPAGTTAGLKFSWEVGEQGQVDDEKFVPTDPQDLRIYAIPDAYERAEALHDRLAQRPRPHCLLFGADYSSREYGVARVRARSLEEARWLLDANYYDDLHAQGWDDLDIDLGDTREL